MQDASEEPGHVADNSAPPRTVWHSRPIRLIVICGILLIGAVIAATAGLLLNLRDRELAESERALERLALVLAEQIDRSFQSIELIQTAVVERMQSLGIASAEEYERQMSGYDTHQRLKDQISALPHISAIVLTNPQGKLINFSRSWPIPSLKVPDQDPSEIFKSDLQLTFFVGKPLRGPAIENWVVPIARKFTGPNGEFLGVVLGIVELQYFEQIFKAIAIAPNGSIALFRRDGTLLARYPHQKSSVGQSFSHSGLFANVLSKTDHGTVRQTGAIDGNERLISARNLAHYPIVVVATTTVADALANWDRGAIYMIGAALMIGLVIGGVVIFSVWLVGKKLREQKLRLDAALSNMSQGLIMFDSAARLVVCNDRYRQIYKLPAELVKPGCTLLDLLKHRVANGTFCGNPEKYVGDLLATIAQGKTTSQEVETGDGRTIAVVDHPIAGGGWVATHEDVTIRQKADAALRESEARFADLFEFSPDALVLVGSTGVIQLANSEAKRLFGDGSDDFVGKPIEALIPEDLRAKHRGLRKDFGDTANRRTMGAAQTHFTALRRDGSVFPAEISVNPISANGARMFCAVVRDITERRRLEEERDRDREFLNQIINIVPATIIVKNASNRRYVLINQAGEEYIGVSRDQIIGKTAQEVWPKATADAIAVHDEELLQSDGYLFFDQHAVETRGKGSRFVTSKRLVIRGKKREPQYLLGVIEDVTERIQSDERIAHLAHYDALTDLPNRVLFHEQFEHSLKWVRRGERLALLYLDIDQFKAVNDTLGHSVGDELLKVVAARLRACLRDTDIIGRLGGDEFAIVQTSVVDPKDVTDLMSRIYEAIRHPCEVGGHQLIPETSIGIALAPDDGTDPDQLLKNADLAMYRAKTDARGTYRFFEPDMDVRVKARRALECDLREAIMCGGFDLYYQPLVNLRDNKVSGCEALLRWRHPERGLILPAEFIPVAEETGLITPLGEWVLRTACAEAATWPDNIKVAVNVSPVQFKNGSLVQMVINALGTSRLPARRLELEITEAVLIRDDEAALAVLHQLRELGVRIALDDFGTGYCSLSYLQRFPFDKIKIDRSFIKDIAEADGSLSIVQAVVSIATSRNMMTTAEGVETEQQLELVRTLGCTEMQGYLFSPPRPAAEVLQLLLSRRERTVAVA